MSRSEPKLALLEETKKQKSASPFCRVRRKAMRYPELFSSRLWQLLAVPHWRLL
jgi:hypothetical protein